MAKADRVELFCQEILKGSSQRQAYYVAYPSSRGWKDSTVDSKASYFARDDKVLARLQELRDQMEEDNRISKNDIITHLSKIGLSDIDAGSIKPSDKIKALELMAKMLGYDQAESKEIVTGVVMIPDVKTE